MADAGHSQGSRPIPSERSAARARPDTWLELRPSPIHGQGVFARRAMPAGTRLLEYTGEVISCEEADRRYDDHAMRHHHTFLFQLSDGRCIDGASGEGLGRFVNHSCEPNCQAIEEDDRIWIETIRPIAAGEELTYDYAYEWEEGDDARASFYRCICGTATCRGTILDRGAFPA